MGIEDPREHERMFRRRPTFNWTHLVGMIALVVVCVVASRYGW